MVNPVRALAEPEAFTIPPGAALSDKINLSGRIPVALYMPAAWTAAGVSFLAGLASDTMLNVHSEDGTELAVTAAASQYVSLDHMRLLGVRWFQLRSGTSGTPVNQAAGCIIRVQLGDPSL